MSQIEQVHTKFVNPLREPAQVYQGILKRGIPLATTVEYSPWRITSGYPIPDPTIGHILAADFILGIEPVPARIKDSVVMRAPDWTRQWLNEWNLRMSRRKLHQKWSFTDHDIFTGLAALAASVAYGYIPCDKTEKRLFELGNTLWNLTVVLENARSNHIPRYEKHLLAENLSGKNNKAVGTR